MPKIELPNEVTLTFSEQWRIAEKAPEETLLELLENEDCQLQVRVMKVTAKSPEQRQQLVISALNNPSPEAVSDGICWTKEPASSDEENHLQRWLMAINGDGANLSVVILDLSVPLDCELDRDALDAQIETIISGTA